MTSPAWRIRTSFARDSDGDRVTGMPPTPARTAGRDPLWYGDDIVDTLLASRIPQDIGCHSFGHVLYGDPDLSRAAVDADLDACLE